MVHLHITIFSYYSKGQCTWGASCRFVHPGVLDKGNYNMFAPPRPILPTEQEPIEKVNNLKKYHLLFICIIEKVNLYQKD